MFDKKITTKPNIETLNVTRALIRLFKLNFPTFKKDIGGHIQEKHIRIYFHKAIDIFKNKNNNTDEKIEIPNIQISFPDLVHPMGVYKDYSKKVCENTEDNKYVFEGDSSRYLDHEYNIKLVSDNTLILLEMISNFVHLFNNTGELITSYDKQNDISREYELEVIDYPMGSNFSENNDGFYEVDSRITVRGVEFDPGRYNKEYSIKEFNLLPFNPTTNIDSVLKEFGFGLNIETVGITENPLDC